MPVDEHIDEGDKPIFANMAEIPRSFGRFLTECFAEVEGGENLSRLIGRIAHETFQILQPLYDEVYTESAKPKYSGRKKDAFDAKYNEIYSLVEGKIYAGGAYSAIRVAEEYTRCRGVLVSWALDYLLNVLERAEIGAEVVADYFNSKEPFISKGIRFEPEDVYKKDAEGHYVALTSQIDIHDVGTTFLRAMAQKLLIGKVDLLTLFNSGLNGRIRRFNSEVPGQLFMAVEGTVREVQEKLDELREIMNSSEDPVAEQTEGLIAANDQEVSDPNLAEADEGQAVILNEGTTATQPDEPSVAHFAQPIELQAEEDIETQQPTAIYPASTALEVGHVQTAPATSVIVQRETFSLLQWFIDLIKRLFCKTPSKQAPETVTQEINTAMGSVVQDPPAIPVEAVPPRTGVDEVFSNGM
jgi:hypothetical protein